MTRELTGKHVLAIVVGGFGTVIAVNIALAVAATQTFPGLVVGNSYVASQHWNRMHAAQAALGWTATARLDDGRLVVDLRDAAGRPVRHAALEAIVGRPSTSAEDRTVTLAEGPDGYAAPVELATGIWRIELHTAGGPAFTHVEQLYALEPL